VRIIKLCSYGLGAAIAGACLTTPAAAIDLVSGDWKFSVDGNINVHYIFSSCQSQTTAEAVSGGLACTGTASGSDVSNVANGLLPAAIVFGVSTTQSGIDIAGHFGLYPGIATNDGGSPNLQQGAPAGTNVALGTTGLDVRQVYLTFGNKDIGTFTLGRNFGLFGFDAIINDMTIPGVGVAGGASGSSPANTTLGSIGLGYIYTDTLGQIDYTTPDYAGFNATVGIFDPLNSLSPPSTTDVTGHVTTDTAAGKRTPGFHAKAAYTTTLAEGVKLSLSATGLYQKQDYITAANQTVEYSGTGVDAFAKLDISGFSFAFSAYHGNGLGTTALFNLSSDSAGHARISYGGLAQATYTFGALKLGVNYGVSRLNLANSTDAAANPSLVSRNSKVTVGAYYALTKSLTLLTEVSNVEATSHAGAENKSTNANIGAFFAF
jgi:predicted porin